MDTLTAWGGSTASTTGLYFQYNDIPYNEVESLQLWHDVNNDAKVGVGDNLLKTLSNFTSSSWRQYGPVCFDNFSLDCPNGDTFLLVALNLKPNHGVGYTFSMYTGQTARLLTFTGGSTYTGPGIAYGQYVETSSSSASLDLGAGYNVPQGYAIRGSISHPILQFRIGQNLQGNTPVITNVIVRGDTTVSGGHTAVPADVTQVRIYKEGSPNGVVDQSDVQLATGTQFGGASAFYYQFGLNESIGPGGMSFLVVADIAAGAGARVIRAYVEQYEIYTDSLWVGSSLTRVTDERQTIQSTAASYLSITTGPTNTQSGVSINSPAGIVVSARKADTSVDTTFGGAVTALIESGPVGGGFTPTTLSAVSAASGVAAFSTVALDKIGTYTLRFVSQPLTFVVTAAFTITPGQPYRIVIVDQPSDSEVGVAIPPPPSVQVEDRYGNLSTSFSSNITASLVSNFTSAMLTGSVIAASNGVAVFPNLQLNRPGAGYQLLFTAAGVAASGASTSFTIVLGPPAQLGFLQQPLTTTGGAVFVPAPRVQVRDAGGNLLPGFVGNMDVAMGNNPTGAALSGMQSITVVGGVATFSDLSVNLAGTNYTLVFSISGGITGASAPFNITVGGASRLVIVQHPTDATGGMAFTPQPVVQVQDAGGNVVTSETPTITAAITSGTGESGGELWGTATLAAVAGQAQFTDLAVTKAGTTPYTLTFTTDAGFAEVVSNSFVISIGPIARVGCSTQPGLASYGAAFMQQPVAQIQDFGGNLIVGVNPNISVSIKPGTGTTGAALFGATTVAAVNGVATFTNLSIDLPGVGFVLTFESGVLIDGDSDEFNVASPGTQLGVVVQPVSSQVGMPLLAQPTVQVLDDFGTLFSADNFTQVTAEIAPNTGTPGAGLTGATTLTCINGVVMFTNLQINTPGTAYRLKFTCYPVLTQVLSEAFDVAGAPVKLLIARQPVASYAGEPFTIQPVVKVCDANDVVCVGESDISVNAYITPATGTEHAILLGTNPIVVVGGIATFTDLGIDRPGQGFKLSFSSSPSLYPATTDSLDVLGEVLPVNNSDVAITAGLDGGSCAGADLGSAPWLLLASIFTLLAVALPRRKRC
ncbi:MAG: hypothetical protein IT462_07295 [Planctomycetes bacterium]|nr:hypothetical protein [Planctomycetota bacterium]